jgi:hypothetical protein
MHKKKYTSYATKTSSAGTSAQKQRLSFTKTATATDLENLIHGPQ